MLPQPWSRKRAQRALGSEGSTQKVRTVENALMTSSKRTIFVLKSFAIQAMAELEHCMTPRRQLNKLHQ